MPTVAEQLRQAREEQKLNIYQVAEITKIKTDHIRALESGSYDSFSAPVYIRGFVRSYAKVLKLDLDRYQAAWDGREVILTLTEFGILRTLLERPGKVCTRDHLMNTAYELHKIVSDRTIDSHVRRIRQKFAQAGGTVIETVHGVGYRLGVR